MITAKIVPVEPVVTLTLSHDEARQLMALIGMFGDELPLSSPLYSALRDVLDYDKVPENTWEQVSRAFNHRARLVMSWETRGEE